MKRFLAYGVLALGFSFAGLGSDGIAQAQQSSLFGGGSSGRGGSSGSSSGGVTTIGGSSGSSGRGGSSSSGMGGSSGSSMGGSGGRSTTGGSNGSSFGSANGRGGAGQNGAGGMNQPQLSEFGSAGNQIGQGSFVGRSNNSGRFVGQAQAGQQQSMSRSNFGGQGGRGGQNGNNNQNFGQGNQTQNTRKIRPQMKLGFTNPPMATTAVSNTLAVRLTAAQASLGSVENVNLKLDDAGVVTLTGRVESPEAKSLAAAILRLEPGVRKVVNDLEVAP